eukprot:6178053-Pleurochrysis_carterae.AAC.4
MSRRSPPSLHKGNTGMPHAVASKTCIRACVAPASPPAASETAAGGRSGMAALSCVLYRAKV